MDDLERLAREPTSRQRGVASAARLYLVLLFALLPATPLVNHARADTTLAPRPAPLPTIADVGQASPPMGCRAGGSSWSARSMGIAATCALLAASGVALAVRRWSGGRTKPPHREGRRFTELENRHVQRAAERKVALDDVVHEIRCGVELEGQIDWLNTKRTKDHELLQEEIERVRHERKTSALERYNENHEERLRALQARKAEQQREHDLVLAENDVLQQVRERHWQSGRMVLRELNEVNLARRRGRMASGRGVAAVGALPLMSVTQAVRAGGCSYCARGRERGASYCRSCGVALGRACEER